MEVKLNTGMLMKNTRKTEDRHPDYTGAWTGDDGVECYLDAWINTSKAGNTYLKLRKGKPKAQQQDAAPAKKHAPVESFDDEDLPF